MARSNATAAPEYLAAFEDGARETIDCPLCGASDSDPVYEGVALRGNDLTCAICLRCSHLFLNPRPPLASFKEFYEDDGYMHLCSRFHHVSLDERMTQFGDERYWVERFGHGERLVSRRLDGELGAGDLVLDLGCGDGAWLWALHEITGCDVQGQEISPVHAELVRERLGVDPYLGPIEEVGCDVLAEHAGAAKLVIVSGSLQHMLDPMECLRVARGALRRDGFLYVCNWSLLDHYMRPYGSDSARLLGECLSWEHPHYFHPGSFRFMLAAAGFEVLSFAVESPVRARHMDALARPAAPGATAPGPAAAAAVVARVRALESAAVADRLREIP